MFRISLLSVAEAYRLAEKKGNRSTHVDWDAAIRTMIIEDVDQTVTSAPSEKFLTEAEFAEEQEHGTDAEKCFLTKARCGNFKKVQGYWVPTQRGTQVQHQDAASRLQHGISEAEPFFL